MPKRKKKNKGKLEYKNKPTWTPTKCRKNKIG
jgi:hypothetical protein